MEVVGQVTDALEVLMAVHEAQADAVVLALDGEEIPGLSSHLLAEFPGLTVLGLAAGERLALLEQLCPSRQRIERGDARAVVRRLRHAIRQPCTPCLEAAPDGDLIDTSTSEPGPTSGDTSSSEPQGEPGA